MAKLIHLKDQKGKSFTVTPHAFETVIKQDRNWRRTYDYVGEVDEEEHAHKSESAIPYVKPSPAVTAEVKKEEVIKGTQEASTKEIFSGSKPGDNNEFINLENKEDEKSKQKQTKGNAATDGKSKSGKSGSKKDGGK